jgi:hypothetical protein
MVRSAAYYRVRNTVRFLAYTALALAAFLGPHALVASASPYVTPCATEDSINCTWHAPTQGNGQGASFTDINGTAYYW